jgi:CheY-like chemotaxis protein
MKPLSEPRKTVILVDSHKSTRITYANIIRVDLGYKVLKTESAEKAFELFVRQHEKGKDVDLIISDVQRNDEVDAGIELCRKIRKFELSHHRQGRPNNIPFILQTGWLDTGHKNNVLEGDLRAADGVAGKATLVTKGNIKVLENAIEAAFYGRKR